MMNALKELFKTVDVIGLPTTAIVAPEIHPSAPQYGELNIEQSGKVMRFSWLANFTGVPSVTVPLGLIDGDHMPCGVQFMAPWHHDGRLLSLAKICEDIGVAQTSVPQVHVDLLSL